MPSYDGSLTSGFTYWRRQCFSYVQIASAATKIFRQNQRKREFVLSSARSAFHVLNLFLMENARTVVVNLFPVPVAQSISCVRHRLLQSVSITRRAVENSLTWRLRRTCRKQRAPQLYVEAVEKFK